MEKPPERMPSRDEMEDALARAGEQLLDEQDPDGYWCYELEADCTIPAEYILMMHFLDEIDASLQERLAQYLREHQNGGGGWPLYHGGDVDISCTVKAYYALKLTGDDPEAPHMRRARRAILERGGAVRSNVLTRITLAQFGQVPWRAVPFMPVEIVLLPRWFPFHLDKISYWSRTVVVPLLILCTLKARARNPRGVGIAELFRTPPEEEADYFPVRSILNHLYLWLDWAGRRVEWLVPQWIRRKAIRRAEAWFIERLNGEHGLGAIFPAMVNAHEALVTLGYEYDHPYRTQARRALQGLLTDRGEVTYCQPCLSPVWDTALACLALQEADEPNARHPLKTALAWLASKQIRTGGDWQVQRPGVNGGGWAFQFANDHYPDLDDTAVVGWAMLQSEQRDHCADAIERAADWLHAMQSQNGGYASFDADNTHWHLNHTPFADHGALLDPPTVDVTGRVVTFLARLERPQDEETLRRAMEYLRSEQEEEGSWFGRWGTNYIYGTWSVLVAFDAMGIPKDDPTIRRAAAWLKSVQREDGGWGESNDSYYEDGPHPKHCVYSQHESTAFQTAWALHALLAAGEADSPEVHRGVAFLLDRQESDGLWRDPWFTAPGFPRVFHLRYHGYARYFPLWALARYRNEMIALADPSAETAAVA